MVSSGPYRSWQNAILHFLTMTKMILFADRLYCVFPHIYSLSHAHVSTLHIFHVCTSECNCRCLQVSWVGGALAIRCKSLLSVSVRVCESERVGAYDNAPVLAVFSRTCMCVCVCSWILLLCRSAWRIFDGCQARLRVRVCVSAVEGDRTFDRFKCVWHSKISTCVCVCVCDSVCCHDSDSDDCFLSEQVHTKNFMLHEHDNSFEPWVFKFPRMFPPSPISVFVARTEKTERLPATARLVSKYILVFAKTI